MTVKKLLFLTTIVIAGLILFSCSSSTKPDEDIEEHQDFEFIDRDISMCILTAPGTEFSAANLIVRKENNEDAIIRIDGIEYEAYDINEVDEAIRYTFILPHLEGARTIQYEVEVDEIHHSGSIKIPDMYEKEFPEFDVTQDLIMNWNMTTNPMHQILSYHIQLIEANKQVDFSEEIAPSARTYTIPSSLFEEFEGDFRFVFNLNAFNAKYHGEECCIRAVTVASYVGNTYEVE